MENKKKKGTEGLSEKGEKIKVIPLGGLEKIGMNITAFEFRDTIIVVDCGISFPEDDMLGIDLVIPDVTYLKKNIEKVKGFCITHGHEDHIGALPYVLKDIPVPVYATKLTQGLISHKLEEHKMDKKIKRKTVQHGQSVNLGSFRVEFIKTNHSIADASALAIHTAAGVILHTGDFKIDYTPLFGDAINLTRFAELGRKGVLALMCDSTNAQRPGFTVSEKLVARTFEALFGEYAGNRLIIATFASNVDRVNQIMQTAFKYGRKVVIQGRSMINVIRIASELGYIHIPDNTLIEAEEMKKYLPEKLVIITTGSQGEEMAGLSRMADGTHRKIRIVQGDVIVFSSTPIPGNEKAVSRITNELMRKGAKIIYQDTHVSGHACQEELKLIYSLVRPRYAIPVHGEYKHLAAQADLAETMGLPKENIFILQSGDILELSEEKGCINGKAEAGQIFVDGLGVGDVGNVVLRDRQLLSENGLILVNMGMDKASGRIVSGPEIITRGFIYVKESEVFMGKIRNVAKKSIDKCERTHVREWGKIKSVVKEDLSDFLWSEIKRTPVILPVILEV